MISRKGDGWLVAGRLTMATVAALFNINLRPEGRNTLEIDFSQVEAVDSAAVSLMLCWLRRAQRENVTLNFSGIPDNLLSLARLYGVAELLPAGNDASAMQS
ncbi:MAG: lipid asymmetry maintenance protein MlaB [Gallionellaceae bacterium]